MANATENTLVYDGCNFFRQRLILATLSGKSVKIRKIRGKHDDPGVKDFEASFIRLLDKITNGSNIIVNETGTTVFYQPGMLMGGTFEHDCNLQRSIGYYLEALLCLAPFCKNPVRATLQGITADQIDPTVDLIKCSSLTVLRKFFGTDEGLEVKICRRGAAPGGGGEVLFTCPTIQKLRPLQFTNSGKVKRIRGTAWATRVSPATTNRIVDACKGILIQFIPDIYIYTDHCKGKQSGRSPGFGLTLVAETKENGYLCAECVSAPQGASDGPTVPEDLGKSAANLLLEEICRGGCVDSTNQSLACLLMILGDKDVSKVQTGPLTPYTIQFLRHLRDFFGVMFKLYSETPEDDEEETRTGGPRVTLTCVGVGFRNLSKVIL